MPRKPTFAPLAVGLGLALAGTTALADDPPASRSLPAPRPAPAAGSPDWVPGPPAPARPKAAAKPTAGPDHNRPSTTARGPRPAAPAPAAPVAARPRADATVRRAQAGPAGAGMIPPSGSTPNGVTSTMVGGQSISLQVALYGALTNNPDLVALRQGTPQGASPEAVEVARHFPTTLNPVLWLDYRPITLIPTDTFGTGSPGGSSGTGTGGTTTTNKHGGFYHYGQDYLYLSLRQPIELGHQTTSRYQIAKAALEQQRWTVFQAELTALVQTYRFFQTAAYRRERLRVAEQLADFNDRLLQTLKRRSEANQVTVADVALATVESRASRQQVKAARQDYLTALADLRNQVGIPEAAGAIEPLGEFTLPAYIPPVDENQMVGAALANRPDIRAARAQVSGSSAAVRLARGDCIPSPVIGPEYEMDEAGVQYIGFVYITPIPVLNTGRPLVRQREAEQRRACIALQQAQQRAVSQVRAAVARWNGATDLVNDSTGLTAEMAKEVGTLERLFEANQTDLTRLMQGRQRLIQLETSRLDAVWAATQAQADLLLALGTPTLINAMLQQARRDSGPSSPASAPAPASGPPPAATPAPFRPAAAAPAGPRPPQPTRVGAAAAASAPKM
ncbi:MAG TPA: TolC family protein [Isosphaeraceae bacterium]|nr:TolC family protein [Isosphaeraceae bacterium]